jgi:hypothetical protein
MLNKKFPHSFDCETGVLECFTYAVNNFSSKEKEKENEYKEQLGLPIEEVAVFGESTKAVLNFNILGGILYFHKDRTELYEKDNLVDTVLVEFQTGHSFVLLIPFTQFKELHDKHIEYLLSLEEEREDYVEIDLAEEIEKARESLTWFEKIKHWLRRKLS